MAVNYGTYYFDGINFAQASALFTDAALTTLAADGFYSQNGIVRQQLNGVLLNSQPCSDCIVPCGSGISANFSGTGWFNADIDLANSTGATIIYAYMTTSVPDGIIANYNSVNYNRLTCKNNGNGVVITEQGGTAVDYAGLNNQGTNLPTYVGNNTFNPVGTFNGVIDRNYVVPSGYQATGNQRTVTAVSTQVGTTGNGSPVFTLVIPKTLTTVTNSNVQIFAPLNNTVFFWQILCPAALPSFQGGPLQGDLSCVANSATYYFARNAIGTTTPFTIDTNTTPEIGNFVFTDINGANYLNDTATLQYIILDNTTALGIRNGVVVSSASCTGGGGPISFQGSAVYPNSGGVICNASSTPTANITYYHNGAGTFPVAGEVVYSDSGGTTTVGDGFYYLYDAGTQRVYIQVTGGNGVVASQSNCTPT